MSGKKIVISGGGAGIGRGITQAFADAGAASIAILGRREDVLLEAKKDVLASRSGGLTITTHVADVTDSAALKYAAREIGGWDVLVSNAGYLSKAVPVAEADEEEWWKGFEVGLFQS